MLWHLNTSQKIRLAGFLSFGLLFFRKLWGKSHWVEVSRRGIRWHLDLREGVDFAIYLNGLFEVDTFLLFQRTLSKKKGAVVLDIGANIGAHALPLARFLQRAGGGRVYAIEPTTWAIQKLQKNRDLNPELAEYLTIVQAFLSNAEGQSQTAVYSSWPLAGGDNKHPIHRGELKSAEGSTTCSLDSLVAQWKLDRLDLIKLDVDGNEWDVLEGGTESLAHFSPDILMEWAPYLWEEKGMDASFLQQWFANKGYHLCNISTGHRLPDFKVPSAFIAPKHGSVNILWRKIQPY